MKPLLLLLTPVPLSQIPEAWSTIWCGLMPMPEIPVPPLCRALYHAEDSLWKGPVALSTILPLPDRLLAPELPDRVVSFLYGPDEGTLYFPDIRLFRRCARDAIRSHNPKDIPPALQDAWCQALLLTGE